LLNDFADSIPSRRAARDPSGDLPGRRMAGAGWRNPHRFSTLDAHLQLAIHFGILQDFF
jgi:hypothetical protein